MKSCDYCGRENEDDATRCRECGTQKFVIAVLPSPPPSVEFIRLFFNQPAEEDYAVRCAQFIAGMVGERIALLRPDTKWSEIFEWIGPSPFHAAIFAMKLKEKFGVEVKEILTHPEFTTFREFVENTCGHQRNAANP